MDTLRTQRPGCLNTQPLAPTAPAASVPSPLHCDPAAAGRPRPPQQPSPGEGFASHRTNRCRTLEPGRVRGEGARPPPRSPPAQPPQGGAPRHGQVRHCPAGPATPGRPPSVRPPSTPSMLPSPPSHHPQGIAAPRGFAEVAEGQLALCSFACLQRRMCWWCGGSGPHHSHVRSPASPKTQTLSSDAIPPGTQHDHEGPCDRPSRYHTAPMCL